jgi:3-mercaptopyruvate sulfurtransferase SseA
MFLRNGLVGLVAVILAASLVISGCRGETSSATKLTTKKPPSVNELTAGGFAQPTLPRIAAETLKVMYDNRDPVSIVDVRARPEFLTGHIPGAYNIPNEPESDFLNSIDKLPKGRMIVVYCD